MTVKNLCDLRVLCGSFFFCFFDVDDALVY